MRRVTSVNQARRRACSHTSHSSSICARLNGASSLGQFRMQLERVTGIEPAFQAWEACVLPLNYTRRGLTLCPIVSRSHDRTDCLLQLALARIETIVLVVECRCGSQRGLHRLQLSSVTRPPVHLLRVPIHKQLSGPLVVDDHSNSATACLPLEFRRVARDRQDFDRPSVNRRGSFAFGFHFHTSSRRTRSNSGSPK